MGQYHTVFNLDKKQRLNPHKLGDGLKLLEQASWSPGGVNDALHLLLPCSNGRGGGDYQSDSPLIGSWCGDRIAIIGDYANEDDIPGVNAHDIYHGEEYQDITDALIPILEREYELVYMGEGWRARVQLSHIEGYAYSHGVGDRHIVIDRKEYASSAVRAALFTALEKNNYTREGKIPLDWLLEAGLKPLP